MANTVRELKYWLANLDEDYSVGIDEGGLTLVSLDDINVYIEIGGIPLDEEGK